MTVMSVCWVFAPSGPKTHSPPPLQTETDNGVITANGAALLFQPCYLQPYQGPDPGRHLGDQDRRPTGCQEAVAVEWPLGGSHFRRLLLMGRRQRAGLWQAKKAANVSACDGRCRLEGVDGHPRLRASTLLSCPPQSMGKTGQDGSRGSRASSWTVSLT